MFHQLLIFAQQAAQPAPDAGPGSWLSNPSTLLIPFGLMMVLYFFLIMGPERKKRAEAAKQLENLKKNDRVVTIGGIYGVVVNTQKNYVTLRIDEQNNTRIKVTRSAISRIVTDESDKAEEEAAK